MARSHLLRGVAGCVWAAALITGASCSGRVIEPGAPDSPSGKTSPLCQSATPAPGPSYVRRLTRHEYNNTVRDLLGDTSGIASTFPAEEKRLGFDNNAMALSVSPVLAEQYLLAAEAVARNAVAASWSKIVPCDPAAAAGASACAQAVIAAFGKAA